MRLPVLVTVLKNIFFQICEILFKKHHIDHPLKTQHKALTIVPI